MISSSVIKKLNARHIFDSKGRPTIEAIVEVADGAIGHACVPSGTTKGKYEAIELRDGGKLFGGLGVNKAINVIKNDIAKCIVGLSSVEQELIDKRLIELDGATNLQKLGGNAVLATSLAVARAAATHLKLPLYKYISQLSGQDKMSLPVPMINIVSGGAHAPFGGISFQDYLVIPLIAENYHDLFDTITRISKSFSVIAETKGAGLGVATDGAFNLKVASSELVLNLLVDSIKKAGFDPGKDVLIALDVAASELLKCGSYLLESENEYLNPIEFSDYLSSLLRNFPIASIEDPFDQDDLDHWEIFTKQHPSLQVVGDDLFATNKKRIEKGIQNKLANAAIIKANQNGTLTGTLNVVNFLKREGWEAIVAGRSGDTEDDFVADLAVGLGVHQIKVGSFYHCERMAKYNRLLRIEEDLKQNLSRPNYRNRFLR